MRRRLQFGGCLLALGISIAVAAPCFAQRPRANWTAQRQEQKQQKQQKQQEKQQRQQQQQAQGGRRQNENGQRPPAPNQNRGGRGMRPNNSPNRPPSAYTPAPPQRRFSELSPQEKQKIIDNNRRLQNLTPAQKQELQDRTAVWNKMTTEQQNHVRNDVLPKWRHMPQDRRQAIRQRLRVLQNMPESARNQRLSDPNFTKGMNEEDKATLRDLSHLHVGGAPDPPNE